MNHGKLRVFISVFLSFALVLSSAPSPTLARETDATFVERLVESQADYSFSVSGFPANKKELVQQLRRDLLQGNEAALDSLLLKPTAATHKIILQGLLNGEDPENIVQLIETLEMNDAEALRFLSAVRESVQKNPERLARVKENLEQLYGGFIATPVRLPVNGIRIMQAFLLIMGSTSIVMSAYPQLVSLGRVDGVLSFSMLFLGLFASAAAGEVIAFKKSWKSYKKLLKRRLRAEKSLNYIRNLVSDLKENPEVLTGLERLKYFTSTYAEQAAIEALKNYQQDFIADIETVQGNPEPWALLKQFLLSRDFFRIMKKYNDQLSETEKRTILASLGQSQELPLTLQVQQLEFEEKIQQEFVQWMELEGHRQYSAQFRRALAKRRQMMDLSQDSSLPRNAYVFTTSALSIAAAVISLNYGAESFNYFGYSQYFDFVANFFNQNSQALIKSLLPVVLVPITYQMWSQYRLIRKIRGNKYKHEINQSRLEQLVPMLPRWFQRKSQRSCQEILLLKNPIQSNSNSE